ncbi:hypothetical protein CLV81_0024 [Flagellimonas meridianipacifica]|uniref:Uncharacterized protein n=1 Tax=Flagellimonas meridianipacifica TaxID=1080225 RepID=A0A2T0MER9_9FLAO|nr:hypothetical protein CLV81_0024 [Allomuricauda pacifica]
MDIVQNTQILEFVSETIELKSSMYNPLLPYDFQFLPKIGFEI